MFQKSRRLPPPATGSPCGRHSRRDWIPPGNMEFTGCFGSEGTPKSCPPSLNLEGSDPQSGKAPPLRGRPWRSARLLGTRLHPARLSRVMERGLKLLLGTCAARSKPNRKGTHLVPAEEKSRIYISWGPSGQSWDLCPELLWPRG